MRKIAIYGKGGIGKSTTTAQKALRPIYALPAVPILLRLRHTKISCVLYPPLWKCFLIYIFWVFNKMYLLLLKPWTSCY